MILGNDRGFSLVELMVVVAIVGVLSAIAIPKMQVFIAKARQAEAKNNLGMMFSKATGYFAEDGFNTTLLASDNNFAGANECVTQAAKSIGFRITECGKARYRYYLIANPGGNFVAFAINKPRAICGCGAIEDVWVVDQSKRLTSSPNLSAFGVTGGSDYDCVKKCF